VKDDAVLAHLARRVAAVSAALLLGSSLTLGVGGSVTPAHGGILVPARVTLNAQPTSLRSGQQATLFGAVSSGRENEEVTIQAKDCGQHAFTGVSVPPLGVAVTGAGGTFTTSVGRFINTTVRAVWRGETSPPIEIRQQPRVVLDRRSGGRFAVAVASKWTFWRKKVQVQRRVDSRWRTVRTVTLTDQISPQGDRSGGTWSEEEFRMRLPRGTMLRAMVTADQAKPCYVSAASDTIRA
jgi:hypothetical protein